MSEQNTKTLDVYEQAAKTYMENNVKHDALDPAKAKLKRARLDEFIKTSFAPLPKNARIFEIGSADGVTFEGGIRFVKATEMKDGDYFWDAPAGEAAALS